jgi:tetratricopeptide (TPR) repeat protein
MMPSIRVPGTVVSAPPEPDLGELRRYGARAENVQAVEVGARRAGEPARTLDVRPDTIVEITLEGGAKFYHRYDQLAADLPGNLNRSATDRDTIDLPLLYAGPATRSGGATVINSLRTFDLNLSALGDVTGGLAGKPLAEWFDSLRADQFGLRTWSLKTGTLGPEPVTPRDLAGSDPLLLFIHGTGSSTQGGFGAIPGLQQGSGPSRAEILKRLQDRYGDRVAAFDHPTLSVSPIDNAIALLSALPVGARLHVVSHSRGGMVGELLCWPEGAEGTVPFAAEIDKIRVRAERAQVNYTAQLTKLAKLGDLLLQQRPVVERFVRVACPAAGTTLASGRLDRWLSLATSALDLTGLGASQVYQFLKGFLLAVVKTRTDPRSVPGLEAMMPGSLLTMLLNRPGVQSKADLSVIAGDIEGGSWLARLGVAAVDWFYGGDHDLVVDTVSMYGGLARTDKARFFFDKGEGVNHFSYFRNEMTLGKMVDGLLRSGDDQAGFHQIEQTQEISEFLSQPRAAGSRPAVFLVPDFMGSHLAADGRRVWIDPAALAQDGFDKLRLDAGGALEAKEMVALAYGPLVKHLCDTYDILPFPYDWRLSVASNGGRFADALRARLAANASDPVRIIAHGSGGLIALAALAGDADLRGQFVGRNGARALLLEPPLQGSVRVARLAVGLDRLTQDLALLALQPDGAEVTATFRGFPGVIDLLPRELLDRPLWQGLSGTGPVPADTLLSQARRWRDQIASVDLVGLPLLQVNAIPARPLRMLAENGSVRFFAGGPPATAATPSSMAGRTWWAQAEPGELATAEALFDVYAELLASGTTTRLPQEAPFSVAAPEAVELPTEAPRMFPDEQELAAAALGYVRRRAATAQRKTVIRLVHGNLAFARWPVGVGHYEGDTLAGGEAQLDRVLNGRLSRRRDLRVYPGRIGTAEIVLDSSQSPKGALVIGLGAVGALTPGSLNRTVSRALRRYAVAIRETRTLPAGQMGISLILIGTGEGGLKMPDAIAALLEAIKYANAMLGEDALTEVELIELNLDRAIAAAQTLLRLEVGRSGAYQDFVFDGFVGTREGGHARSAPLDDPAWWRRLKVEAREDGALQFTDLTDRARLPTRPVASQSKVSGFVSRAVTERLRASEFSASGTLYELLLPADFKRETGDDRSRILVLDTVTASYPWELLRRPGRADEKPLSVRAGMVRQLTEADTPDRPVVTTGKKALVVGNPPTGLTDFPSLRGAGEEARRVRDLLKRYGFSADEDRIERTDGSDSLPAILCGRWQIMHLAGHGAVDFRLGDRTVTGMALENGSFFGPEDVQQMEAIPELVFLNCCYLGTIDPTAERKASARFHELAANVARAFIKLGARAVIAAGWAVDDAAAQRFAEVFYDRLLGRCSFGEATLAARKAVYASFGHTNTWGAYQCYGDPAYQLSLDTAGAATRVQESVYVHPEELINEIRDIAQDTQTLATRDLEPLRARLTALAGSPFLTRWSENSELQAALGRAYADLGMIDDAITAYTRAVEAEKAYAPIRVIEQLANLRTRRAARRADPNAEKEIRAAIKMVTGLPQFADGEYTSERWSLLGSCNKRLAQVAEGTKRSKALEEMYRCYGRAFERAKAAERFDTYSLLNRLTAEALLRLLDAPRKIDDVDLEASLVRAETEARRRDSENPDFWTGVALADIALGRALLQGRLDDGVQQDAIAAYLRPWRRGGSALQFASVMEQIDFLIVILSDKTALRDGLNAIKTQLTAATGVS